MLYYAFVFLLLAIVAGILGFGAIAGTAALIAKVLFLTFMVLFVASAVLVKRKPNHDIYTNEK